MKLIPRISIFSCLASLLLGSAGAIRVNDGAPALLAYRLKPGDTMRYKLTANVKGSVPLFESPTPIDLDAILTLVYQATPKTLMADGSADVEFKVESAEVEVAKIPFPVPIEDVQKVLDQTVTLSKMGEVIKGNAEKAAPFNLSIPALDPTRLYALLFPVVFQPRPVKAGDTWTYKSELLGGNGANPKFTATVLETTPADGKANVTRLRENVEMKVDTKVNADKKPVTDDADAYKTRKGTIQGSGVLHFNRTSGRFTRSEVELNAKIQEDLVGTPKTPDEPKQVISTVSAKVVVQLMPKVAALAAPVEKGKKAKQ